MLNDPLQKVRDQSVVSRMQNFEKIKNSVTRVYPKSLSLILIVTSGRTVNDRTPRIEERLRAYSVEKLFFQSAKNYLSRLDELCLKGCRGSPILPDRSL